MRRLAAALVLACPLWLQAEPLLIHLHAMAFSPDGRSLLVSSHVGLTAWRGDHWSHELETGIDITGFSAAARGLYASGHPEPGGALRNPIGLARSDDGARWRSLALEGEADFHVIAAGERTDAIYVLSHLLNAAMPDPGIHLTRDEGKTWKRPAARGLRGEVLALAAHPSDGTLVAAATDRGVYLSRDAGEGFRRVFSQAVTAVTFALEGKALMFTPTLANEIVRLPIDGGRRSLIRLPRLRGDYATHIALHPTDGGTIAVGTRRRDVYLSTDGGKTWRRIARDGELP